MRDISINGTIGVDVEKIVSRLCLSVTDANPVYYITAFKHVAADRSLDTQQLIQLMLKDFATYNTSVYTDRIINEAKSLKKEGKLNIISSSVGWFVEPESYKILLYCNPHISYNYVLNNAEVYAKQKQRIAGLTNVCGVDTLLANNYDIVIDVTNLSESDVEYCVMYCYANELQGIYVNPKDIYTTRSVREIRGKGLSNYVSWDNESAVSKYNIHTFLCNGYFIVQDGHHRLASAIVGNKDLIKVDISADVSGYPSTDVINKQWEKEFNFKYQGYRKDSIDDILCLHYEVE